MEIGSIYEMDPGLLRDAERKDSSSFRREFGLKEVEKYGKKYNAYTASGRDAIALALKSFAERYPEREKSCLLPAYMCDTVFLPFVSAGWKIFFYEIEKNLEADREKLSRQMENIRPSLLFIHAYYGVDTWKPMRSLLHTWRRQGICIMEDVTQSYYLPEAGKDADYVVGSLRKWYPVPDGGFVASDENVEEQAKALTVNEAYISARIGFLTKKWEYLHGTGSAQGKTAEELAAFKADYLQKNRETENWMDENAKAADGRVSAMSEVSKAILENMEEAEYRQQRNENYAYLYERLNPLSNQRPLQAGRSTFSPVFSMDETVEAPLYFPVYAQNRDDLQEYLKKHHIYAPVLWPIGEENADILTENETYIYEHILALPMDQRYGLAEMKRMADVMEAYVQEKEQDAPVKQAAEENRQTENREIIGVRADANDTVATGHIMRCITIAKELKKRGKGVLFFTADTYAHEMLLEAGMEAVCLDTEWNRMEQETERLKAELQKVGCGKLLVDSYQATKKYFESLGETVKLIYVDDCFEDVYPVDMIINYNAFYTRFPYEKAYREEGKMGGKQTRLLLGTEYVPLREEFGQEKNKGKEESGREMHVLLASGGGDTYDALSGILTAFYEKREKELPVVFHVVAGGFYRKKKELLALAEKYPNIKVHVGVKRMAELMRQCDGAVSAAGTMLFELCAMQIPTVFFVSADNQKYDSEFFAAEERMLFAGDIRTDREACLEKIGVLLEELLADEAMRDRMKAKLKEVTDGNGAARIAEAMIKL